MLVWELSISSLLLLIALMQGELLLRKNAIHFLGESFVFSSYKVDSFIVAESGGLEGREELRTRLRLLYDFVTKSEKKAGRLTRWNLRMLLLG